VPANETLTFIVGGVCGVPIYSVTIGPYASDTDLGTVIVPLPQNLLTTVSGTASCNGVPLTSGAVRVLQNGSLVATTTIEPDGSFSTDYVSCDTSEVTVRVVNYATLEVGEATFTYSNAINTGDIGACTIALTNFFELTFDGMTFVGDSCNFYADGGELGLYGSYIGSNNVFGNLGFSLFDPSLPMPIVVGTYTAPPSATNPNGTTRGASLNLNGFPGVPDFNYDVSSFPYEITAVGNQTSPYTTGTIGPGTVQLLDSAGTVISTHTLEIDFSAYNF